MRYLLQYTLLALLAAVPSQVLAQGNAVIGARTFSTNCSGCHGSDGRGGERAPNIATARTISSLADKELASIVRNGVTGSGMPSFSFLSDKGIADLVAYLRVLQGKTSDVKVAGDSEVGHSLFFGQAGCSNCHMVHGEGGYIASDLTDYGSGTSPEVIREAIIEPLKVVPAGSQVVNLITSSGQKISGVLRSEDNFNVIILTHDGHFQRYAKSTLTKLDYTGRSLMPTDYKEKLSPSQLDDIVGYLIRSANAIEPINRLEKGRAP